MGKIETFPVNVNSSQKRTNSSNIDFIWLEITKRCNLECTHCYAGSNPRISLEGRMRKSDWIHAIDEAKENGCTKVQFIGGEPLLVPYIDELILHAYNSGFVFIEVFSNATFIQNKHIELFKKCHVHVATSFYSHIASCHDTITGKPGSWLKTVESIKKVCAAELPIRAGIITMDSNAGHDVSAANLLLDLGVKDVGIDKCRAVGRGENIKPSQGYYNELCGRCGDRRFCLTTTGDFFPCIMSNKTKLGNFLEDGWITSIETNVKLSNFRTKLLAAKKMASTRACTPDCWPHGGCAPHDICRPHKATVASLAHQKSPVRQNVLQQNTL